MQKSRSVQVTAAVDPPTLKFLQITAAQRQSNLVTRQVLPVPIINILPQQHAALQFHAILWQGKCIMLFLVKLP
jgi:hypothetical protein